MEDDDLSQLISAKAPYGRHIFVSSMIQDTNHGRKDFGCYIKIWLYFSDFF